MIRASLQELPGARGRLEEVGRVTGALQEIRAVRGRLLELEAIGKETGIMEETTLEVFVGESKTWTLVVEEDGERADLTDATIDFVVRRRDGDTDPAVVELSVGEGITVRADQADSSPDRGIADIVLPSSATTPGAGKPSAGNWRFDVAVAWPDDDERKYPVRGPFIVRPVVAAPEVP